MAANLTLQDLDGKYIIQSQTSDGGPYKINSDGVTVISKGRTARTDSNGYIWSSVFTPSGKNKVMLESTCDPSKSNEDNFIKDNKNNLTRDKVVYRGELQATEKKGKLVLEGEIKAGVISTRLVMTKV